MVESFFDNREIFITGGSGVVGKGIIEKLLRSCSVKTIYMLLREKKGVSAKERLNVVKEASIFNVLKEKKPNELDKLVAIPGDVQYPGLGLSDESKAMLQNVSIIYHSAATVRFDEPLRVAIILNVRGTLETVKLASTLKQLELFVHISTFYSNPYLKFVGNKIYPPPMDWRKAIKLAESDIPTETLEAVTRKVINLFPNTYTFTKNLGEQIVNEYRHKIPAVIFRPSIVIFSFKEPEPGFIDSHYGLTGLTTMNGTGLLRTLYASKQIRLDKTPLDIGIKVLLLQTVKNTNLYKEKQPETLPIFHFSSSQLCRYNMREEHDLIKYKYAAWEVNAFEKMVWLPHLTVTECRPYFVLRVFLYQLIPSILIDLILRLFNIQPVAMLVQRKMFIAADAIKHFLFNTYDSDGLTDIDELEEMSKNTSFEFADDVKFTENEIKEEATFHLFSRSSRKFILKEDDSTLPRSRRVYKVLEMLDYAVRGYIYYWMGKTAIKYAYNYFEDYLV